MDSQSPEQRKAEELASNPITIAILALLGVSIIAVSQLFGADSLARAAISSLGTSILTLAVIDLFFKVFLNSTLHSIGRNSLEVRRLREVQERQAELMDKMQKAQTFLLDVEKDNREFDEVVHKETLLIDVSQIKGDLECLQNTVEQQYTTLRDLTLEDEGSKPGLRELYAEVYKEDIEREKRIAEETLDRLRRRRRDNPRGDSTR